jgi:hypothetical protein
MLRLGWSLLVIWTQLLPAWPGSIVSSECKLQPTLQPVADLAVALLRQCGSSGAPNRQQQQQQQRQGGNARASSSSSSGGGGGGGSASGVVADASALQAAQANAAAIVLDTAKAFNDAVNETRLGLNPGLTAIRSMPSVHALLLLRVACYARDLHKQQQGQSPLLLAKVYHCSLTGVFKVSLLHWTSNRGSTCA